MQEKNISTPRRRNFWFLVVSLLLIWCGFYMLLNPETALIASALVIGTTFIVMGFGYVMAFKRHRSYFYPIIGILDMLIGVILLANLGLTAATMPIIFGFWCLFVGTTQFIAGLQLRRDDLPFGTLTLTIGFVGMIFGVLLFLYPVFGVFTITFLLGTYLLIDGFYEMGRYFRLA